ncbi:MAG: ATP-dependent DNA helicase [Bowdeniella nasicola]|nr:ATP-dependent DNA helicase [Bowdeniella nasicola]
MPSDLATTAEKALALAIQSLGGAHRAGQATMLSDVVTQLQTPGVSFIQAGTGTGKTLAYLIPALAYAHQGDGCTIISTATLALQRQIMRNDAPLARAALANAVDLPAAELPEVALLKGWHHYLCWQKLTGGYAQDELDLEASDADAPTSSLGEEIVRLRAWADTTTSGDRDDLNPGVSDRAWRQVSLTRHECLGKRCPMVDECFAMAARENAARAGVVVTNHTLIGLHAHAQTPILPDFSALIVDEAHEVPERVSAAATVQVSAAQLTRWQRILTRAGEDECNEHLDALGDVIGQLPAGRLKELPGALADVATVLQGDATTTLTALRKEADSNQGPTQQAIAAATDIREVCQRLLGENIAAGHDVMWVERHDDRASLHVAPLRVAGVIASQLCVDRAVVFTSATLQVGGSIHPFATSVGAREYRSIDVGSPFHYREQGILYIPTHVPPPDRDGVSEEAIDVLAELVAASGGGALGLFSSHRSAERAAAKLRLIIDRDILVQGEGQLSELVDRFRAEEDTCLFGTLSLWQGVDAPGRTCRLVVIDRIPFPRPDEPLIQARSEAVARAGGNAFMQVSATAAGLLLAQGAGRLIRRSDDRGMVAILDPRLATARYGAFLRQGLPDFWPTKDLNVALGALSRL